jgi:hypothetical protein
MRGKTPILILTTRFPLTHSRIQPMFHATRNADGTIQSLSRQSLPNSELLDEQNPEVQLFLHTRSVEPALDASDADFVRVIEDLIDTLIQKNVIRHTDLPVAVQKKLMLRKGLRNRMQGSLDLLESDPGVL